MKNILVAGLIVAAVLVWMLASEGDRSSSVNDRASSSSAPVESRRDWYQPGGDELPLSSAAEGRRQDLAQATGGRAAHFRAFASNGLDLAGAQLTLQRGKGSLPEKAVVQVGGRVDLQVVESTASINVALEGFAEAVLVIHNDQTDLGKVLLHPKDAAIGVRWRAQDKDDGPIEVGLHAQDGSSPASQVHTPHPGENLVFFSVRPSVDYSAWANQRGRRWLSTTTVSVPQGEISVTELKEGGECSIRGRIVGLTKHDLEDVVVFTQIQGASESTSGMRGIFPVTCDESGYFSVAGVDRNASAVSFKASLGGFDYALYDELLRTAFNPCADLELYLHPDVSRVALLLDGERCEVFDLRFDEDSDLSPTLRENKVALVPKSSLGGAKTVEFATENAFFMFQPEEGRQAADGTIEFHAVRKDCTATIRLACGVRAAHDAKLELRVTGSYNYTHKPVLKRAQSAIQLERICPAVYDLHLRWGRTGRRKVHERLAVLDGDELQFGTQGLELVDFTGQVSDWASLPTALLPKTVSIDGVSAKVKDGRFKLTGLAEGPYQAACWTRGGHRLTELVVRKSNDGALALFIDANRWNIATVEVLPLLGGVIKGQYGSPAIFSAGVSLPMPRATLAVRDGSRLAFIQSTGKEIAFISEYSGNKHHYRGFSPLDSGYSEMSLPGRKVLLRGAISSPRGQFAMCEVAFLDPPHTVSVGPRLFEYGAAEVWVPISVQSVRVVDDWGNAFTGSVAPEASEVDLKETPVEGQASLRR